MPLVLVAHHVPVTFHPHVIGTRRSGPHAHDPWGRGAPI
jgi:hypothetical protein